MLTLQNTSYTTRTLIPTLDDPANVFNLASRTDDSVLLPGEIAEYQVLFRPEVVGTYTGAIDLGDGMPVVPLHGVCAEVVRGLTVWPAEPTLAYAWAGQIATGSAVVTNTGLTTLSIDP